MNKRRSHLSENELAFLGDNVRGNTLILGCEQCYLPVVIAGSYGIPVFVQSLNTDVKKEIFHKAQSIGIQNIKFFTDIPVSEIQKKRFETIIVLNENTEGISLGESEKFLVDVSKLIYQQKNWKRKSSWKIINEKGKNETRNIRREHLEIPGGINITIGIATYNRAWCLADAIESVFAQTVPNWELIIIDDGSTDNTENLVKKYSCVRLKYIKQKNHGCSATRNRIFHEAKGSFVLWLDSDDILLPNIVNLYLKQIKRLPSAGVIYSDLWVFNNYGIFKRKRYPDYKNSLDYIQYLLNENPLPNSSTAIRKEYFKKTEGYNPNNFRDEDYEFWARLAKVKCPLYHIQLPLIKCRVDYLTHNNENILQKKDRLTSYKSTVNTIFSLPANVLFPDLNNIDETFREKRMLIRKMEMFLRRGIEFSIPDMVKEITVNIRKRKKSLCIFVLLISAYLKKMKILRRATYKKILYHLENFLF